ncbi:uncharacterized protein BDV17DRAFT_232520 [Aspergillus undulatus]|uniref:uncharacterized protein n=1 Tax=Aspergillus undulatus TaxID=1810928 RepID=UPI003CCCBB53
MVISDAVCAALDHGGGVRFGPQTFAIYSCAPLPASYNQFQNDVPLYTKLKVSASRVIKTLPIYVNVNAKPSKPLADPNLESLPVPRTQQPPTNTIYHLPWFLINSATLEKHCVIGNETPVESLLVILQRPWCVLEVCCADTEAVAAVREFARLAAGADPDVYDAAVRLLSHEFTSRMASASATTDLELGFGYWDFNDTRRCSERALRDIYAATTLSRSYNRFWLPLICCCAVYLDVPFSEVVRRIRDDSCDGSDGLKKWIELYSALIGRVGDLLT